MNLDTKYIAAGEDADFRMIRMWERLIEANGGISARLLFHIDNPIEVPGWRWAPKSLLASGVDDVVLGVNERMLRFLEDGFPQNPRGICLGVPTLLGLKVKLPGCRVIATPISPGYPLHPWPQVIRIFEDYILAQDERTGQWVRISDWYQTMKFCSWRHKQGGAYDKHQNGAMCRLIHSGDCAILMDRKLPLGIDKCHTFCLLQVQEVSPKEMQNIGHADDEGVVPLKGRRRMTLMLSALDERESHMMDKIKDLASVVAADMATIEFLQVQKCHEYGSREWEAAQSKVRKRMKEVMREAWLANPDLGQTMRDTTGEDLKECAWAYIPKLFSHNIVLTGLEGQLWFVD